MGQVMRSLFCGVRLSHFLIRCKIVKALRESLESWSLAIVNNQEDFRASKEKA
jgi:hypothetical protein